MPDEFAMPQRPERLFWGDALVPWPADVVAEMALGELDALYLRDVGLPVGIDWILVPSVPTCLRQQTRS
jgi:hypothetical protein